MKESKNMSARGGSASGGKKTKNKNAWDKISKSYFKLIIPNRPSLGDIKNYGQTASLVLKNKKNPKIMVMGSTPELRAMLYKFRLMNKAEVVCLDVSEDMYKAMSNLNITKNSHNEKHVKSSWLKSGFKDNYFDLILGDEVICNIPFDLHKDLFKEISRVMKNNGAWITRHNFSTTKDKKTNYKKIMENLAVKISNSDIDFNYAVNLLFADIFYYTGWHNPSNNSMKRHLNEMKKVYAKSFSKHPMEKIVKELIDLYDNFWVKFSGDYKWCIFSRDKSRKELEEFFIIKKELYANDYPTVKNSPIYLLRKR